MEIKFDTYTMGIEDAYAIIKLLSDKFSFILEDSNGQYAPFSKIYLEIDDENESSGNIFFKIRDVLE